MLSSDRLTASAAGLAPGNGYSHAVVTSGRTAFVPGQVALDEDGAVDGGPDVFAQTTQAPRNLERVLGDQLRPASTLVQVAALFRPELVVEVDAVVSLPG